MALVSTHGGQCCGIRNLYDFRYPLTKENIKAVEEANDHVCGVIEIALTEHQLGRDEILCKLLSDNNFIPVSRFKNPNTDNIIVVFHKYIHVSYKPLDEGIYYEFVNKK